MSGLQRSPTECRSRVLGSQDIKVTPDVWGNRSVNTKSSLIKVNTGKVFNQLLLHALNKQVIFNNGNTRVCLRVLKTVIAVSQGRNGSCVLTPTPTSKAKCAHKLSSKKHWGKNSSNNAYSLPYDGFRLMLREWGKLYGINSLFVFWEAIKLLTMGALVLSRLIPVLSGDRARHKCSCHKLAWQRMSNRPILSTYFKKRAVLGIETTPNLSETPSPPPPPTKKVFHA